MIPSLKDLVMLFLRERYPYWKFKWIAEYDPSVIVDENGHVYASVGDEDIALFDGPNCLVSRANAVDPDFFEKLAAHVLAVRREQNSIK